MLKTPTDYQASVGRDLLPAHQLRHHRAICAHLLRGWLLLRSCHPSLSWPVALASHWERWLQVFKVRVSDEIVVTARQITPPKEADDFLVAGFRANQRIHHGLLFPVPVHHEDGPVEHARDAVQGQMVRPSALTGHVLHPLLRRAVCWRKLFDALVVVAVPRDNILPQLRDLAQLLRSGILVAQGARVRVPLGTLRVVHPLQDGPEAALVVPQHLEVLNPCEACRPVHGQDMCELAKRRSYGLQLSSRLAGTEGYQSVGPLSKQQQASASS